MPKRKGLSRGCGCLYAAVVLVVVSGLAAWGWLRQQTLPVGSGEPRLVRIEKRSTLRGALTQLAREGIVRNVDAALIVARFERLNLPVSSGTYRLSPTMDASEVLRALRQPIRQMVRIPETNWAARNARLLEQKGVLKADEYMALVRQPQRFQSLVDFPLPKDSLEGYLFPDTYELPPLLGAEGVILRQLAAFQQKVWEPLGKPKDLHRILTVASMVELEAKLDRERPVIAGVIENRIRRRMPLQIDATVLYGLQEWRRLTFRDYYETDSPYNTYRIRGLPPGPICSPRVESIRAAMDPARHEYLFYVALPSGEHLFSRTYAEHNRNIARRKAAIAALDGGGTGR